MTRPGGAEAPPARLVVGIMGSANGPLSDAVRQQARRLGRAVAEHGCALITGACPGLPHEAVRGAKELGGLVVGVSPALSRQEHVERYASPVDGYDVLIFTGSGLMGREVAAAASLTPCRNSWPGSTRTPARWSSPTRTPTT